MPYYAIINLRTVLRLVLILTSRSYGSISIVCIVVHEVLQSFIIQALLCFFIVLCLNFCVSSAGCSASISFFSASKGTHCSCHHTFYSTLEKYGNAIIVHDHALTLRDANFQGAGQRWSYVIIGKLEWGCRIY